MLWVNQTLLNLQAPVFRGLAALGIFLPRAASPIYIFGPRAVWPHYKTVLGSPGYGFGPRAGSPNIVKLRVNYWLTTGSLQLFTKCQEMTLR